LNQFLVSAGSPIAELFLRPIKDGDNVSASRWGDDDFHH
jgi:hypothetical protein